MTHPQPDAIPADPVPPGIPWRWPEARTLLERTPRTLECWLADLPEPWLRNGEGGESWSPYQVLGHLIHGERTDWVPRIRHVLEGRAREPFRPVNRFAMLRDDPERPVEELLQEFARLRRESLEAMGRFAITEEDLERPGLHPLLGPVTLRQLLSTWVAHDLTHLGQIARVMAKQYRNEVGPWREYLPLLDR